MNIEANTPNEIKALAAIADGDKYDDLHTLHFLDISEITGIPPKQLRGVVSSLVQKDLVVESALDESWSLPGID